MKFVDLSSKMSKIGPVDPEIWAKTGLTGVPERFFEKISRNTTDTEKMLMTNIIGNFLLTILSLGWKWVAISRNMVIYTLASGFLNFLLDMRYN